ncbi:MAG TPA: MFS transporter [Candidatus Sulfopaludibacter sp.]|nr:MFS transporter [Candidatus Sulfopaludibacter sp.]
MTESRAARYRWLVLCIFVLSSAINYLDRQTLAALAPVVEGEFHLTRAEFGWILGVFSATYALAAPLAGMLIDRIGLNLASSLAIGVWSCAGIATGFTQGLRGLMGCRTVLGAAEAGGIPAAGKAIHQYLHASERALGNAVNQAGVSLGAIVAPPLAAWINAAYGWRFAFVATGVLGLLWIPLWNFTARRTAAPPIAKSPQAAGASLLSDRRIWAFMLANAVAMVGYSLWTNWTTQYLVDKHGLTLKASAGYAWIPPAVALIGGFAGGWLSRRFMLAGVEAPGARFRVCLLAAVLALATAAVPLAPTPGWTAAAISLSIFAVSAFSTNMYSLPLDVFGGPRAAFAISMLVASYGAVQLVISPIFGALMDHHQWPLLAGVTALTPLAACAVLWASSASPAQP